MQKLSACRKRGSSIHFFSSTSMRCIMAIWPAGPPKLMQPILNQSRNASPNAGEGSAPAGTASVCTVISGCLFDRLGGPVVPLIALPLIVHGAAAAIENHRRIGGTDARPELLRRDEIAR